MVAWAASARREHARVTVNKVTTHLRTHYCLTLYYGDAGSADDDGRGGLTHRYIHCYTHRYADGQQSDGLQCALVSSAAA